MTPRPQDRGKPPRVYRVYIVMTEQRKSVGGNVPSWTSFDFFLVSSRLNLSLTLGGVVCH